MQVTCKSHPPCASAILLLRPRAAESELFVLEPAVDLLAGLFAALPREDHEPGVALRIAMQLILRWRQGQGLAGRSAATPTLAALLCGGGVGPVGCELVGSLAVEPAFGAQYEAPHRGAEIPRQGVQIVQSGNPALSPNHCTARLLAQAPARGPATPAQSGKNLLRVWRLCPALARLLDIPHQTSSPVGWLRAPAAHPGDPERWRRHPAGFAARPYASPTIAEGKPAASMARTMIAVPSERTFVSVRLAPRKRTRSGFSVIPKVTTTAS
jgi:hypothetical protein